MDWKLLPRSVVTGPFLACDELPPRIIAVKPLLCRPQLRQLIGDDVQIVMGKRWREGGEVIPNGEQRATCVVLSK